MEDTHRNNPNLPKDPSESIQIIANQLQIANNQILISMNLSDRMNS